MLVARKVLTRGIVVASCAAAWLGFSGCSGSAFSSDTGGAGGDVSKSGSAGDDSTGNSGGSTSGSGSGGIAGEGGEGPPLGGSGGSAGAGRAGSGGSGGTTPVGCSCKADQYCRDGTADCLSCASFTRYSFAPPERLSTLSDNGQGSTFPRIGVAGTDLLYVFAGTGMRYTTDFSTSAGSSVKGTLPGDSGPLLLANAVSSVAGATTLTSFNFLFDRAVGGTRHIFIGNWSGGLQTSEQAPPAYNADANDYSVAVALHPGGGGPARAYWMASGAHQEKPTLMTAELASDAAAAPASNLSIGQKDCPTTEQDLTPWVVADASQLLISHTRLDDKCAAQKQGKDIYTVLLNPSTGEPAVPAQLVNDVNSPMDDISPSFSANMCDLYFASNRDGKLAVYRAHRH